MIHNKKGTDEFRTVVNIILGTIFFIIIAVAMMFFMTGQEIKATYEAGSVEADKIATRIIFSRNCFALAERITADWYSNVPGEDRNESHLVRLGIIDRCKWNNTGCAGVLPFGRQRIQNCVGYTLSEQYQYILDIGGILGMNTLTIEGLSGDGSTCDTGMSIDKRKIYPVLVYDGGNLQNAVLKMNLRFCYFNETVG